MVKMKQCKLSDLSLTRPDTWSADTTGLPFISINDMDSGSEGERDDVVMETETCSPATPSKSDNFFESSCIFFPPGDFSFVPSEKPSGDLIHLSTEFQTLIGDVASELILPTVCVNLVA
jgi:hypothetical protein